MRRGLPHLLSNLTSKNMPTRTDNKHAVVFFSCVFDMQLCGYNCNKIWIRKTCSPKTETVASDSGIDVAKVVITHSSPDSIISDFQTSSGWWRTASQPHCQNIINIKLTKRRQTLLQKHTISLLQMKLLYSCHKNYAPTFTNWK